MSDPASSHAANPVLCQTLGYERYHVLGWSDGGNSGVILAALRPENVTKLVIWGANAYVSDKDLEMYEGE